MQNMGMMGGMPNQKMPGQAPDFNKLFTAERGFLKAFFLTINYFRKY